MKDEAIQALLDELNRDPARRNFAGYSSMVVSKAAGVKHYVVWTEIGLLGVSPNGQLLWYWLDKGYTNAITPIVKDDLVFSSCGHGDGCVLIRLSAGENAGQLNPKVVYHKKTRGDFECHFGSVIQIDGRLYYGHGRGLPSCLDLESGERVWKKARGAGSGSVSASFADGHLYFRYADGTIELVEIGTEEYQSKGSFEVPAKEQNQAWSRPVIYKKQLLIRTQSGELLCYELSR